MNLAMIIYTLGWVVKVEGAGLLLPCLIAGVYREKEGLVYLICALVFMALGFLMTRRKPDNTEIYVKEGMVTVAASWLVLSVIGAIPFLATGEFTHVIDAFFEIVSGFTTTGASIRDNVENLCHATLFWRSFSHWIGGMGVLVFILMLVPVKSGSRMNLMRAESPGYDVSKFVPKVRDSATVLYRIYIALTLLQIVILLISGMYWFDSLCITFGSAGTGGFAVLNSSCASYTPAQQVIITVFMALFGCNFAFYYLIITKRVFQAFKMEEIRTYIGILIAAALVIAANIYYLHHSVGETLRESFFQTVSIMTTTGYATADFNAWPALSKTVLVILMCIGACAGSTGGGMKVSRLIVCMKENRRTLKSYIHPRGVFKIRMDGRPLEENMIDTINLYMILYIGIFALSVLLLSLNEFSFETNFSAVAATINNIGPGLDQVGPTANYAGFTVFSKLILIFDMLAGRLELFPMLFLLYPKTWRHNTWS